MPFHQRLKHERLVKGWTIEQLSQASGVTANRISMLERNLVEIVSDGLKEALAKALGVNFDAPPSVAQGVVVQEPVSGKQAAAVPVSAAPAVPEPFALHLSVHLRQQLESAAHAFGRSLHGEILARLEASLADTAVEVAISQNKKAAATTPSCPQPAACGVIQLSEADLAHITELVAQRLQVRP